jgi:hypothetical protein
MPRQKNWLAPEFAANALPGLCQTIPPKVNPAKRRPEKRSFGLAVDAAGNIDIADAGNSRVRQVDAGRHDSHHRGRGINFGLYNGAATSAALVAPHALAIDASGNLLIAYYLAVSDS